MDRTRVSGMACLLVTCLFFTLILFQSGPPTNLPDSKSEREAQKVSFNERSVSASFPHKANASLPQKAASTVASLLAGVVEAFTPSTELTFAYGGVAIDTGAELSLSEAEVVPEVEIGGTKEDFYTLLLVDPDAPSPDAPTEAQWLHWLVINIPGGAQAAKGKEVIAYNGPAPPEGRHRYVFLSYKQAGELSVQPPAKRNCFQAQAFAKEHKLGDPVAASLFYSSAKRGANDDGEAQAE